MKLMKARLHKKLENGSEYITGVDCVIKVDINTNENEIVVSQLYSDIKFKLDEFDRIEVVNE